MDQREKLKRERTRSNPPKDFEESFERAKARVRGMTEPTPEGVKDGVTDVRPLCDNGYDIYGS